MLKAVDSEVYSFVHKKIIKLILNFELKVTTLLNKINIKF